MPEHVRDDVRRGFYHGGPLAPDDYDYGHDGWTLQNFVEHEHSHSAMLSETNVLAVRYQQHRHQMETQQYLYACASTTARWVRRERQQKRIYTNVENVEMQPDRLSY